MEAVVLVGGLGTRLRSVVGDRPKAMALVDGRPFLEWLIEDLRVQGVKHVVLGTGYMGEPIEQYFGSGHSWGVEIHYSRENSPLGTGGAVKFALSKVRGASFFVLNGDSFCDFDLRTLNRVHSETNAMATLWLVSVDNNERYGEVTVNSQMEITAFREKPESKRAGLISAGVYLLDRRIIEVLDGNSVLSLENDVFPHLIGRGLYGVVGSGPFLDIGTPDSYKSAEQFVRRHRA